MMLTILARVPWADIAMGLVVVAAMVAVLSLVASIAADE